ncbi:A/G-specific adenine glycosylase [Paraliobacillus quinghaiensis]|uniref:Adenine DNA glycosylase n=1 Tax=Paraliobacillus quinghaiensis TaxID=470815 RepID=A0A917WUQ9_9BACI|nr:A/G-specific adenine glycosylase [Paraliobacillus quinghaiensis]GGM29744.1 A/G-specific adenine glycosylase [Paraliobacillus quinghaiensis]
MKENELQDLLNDFNITKFKNDLIDWFEMEQRILPWREDQDPYKVWVSEIMLQQTKVDTVIPYFQRFISKFPTVEKLAYADEQEVLKAWEGLGYYSRARNLQHAVREVAEAYNGKVPDNPEQLAALKGVGPYTKGAILSIAYDIPEPAVDGNVMRVLSRVLRIEEDIAKPRSRRIFEAAVQALISHENPSSFNQGLMELGALICTPKSPSCMLCPVQTHCKAFRDGVETELPIKSKAKKQKRIGYYAFAIENDNNEYLIEQRPDTGLLASMWQFPMVEKHEVDEEHILTWIQQVYGLSVNFDKKLLPIKHVFSHVIWEMDVIHVTITNSNADLKQGRFVDLNYLEKYPFPVPHQKLVDQLNQTR